MATLDSRVKALERADQATEVDIAAVLIEGRRRALSGAARPPVDIAKLLADPRPLAQTLARACIRAGLAKVQTVRNEEGLE